jgi:hypothetical protein
MYVRPACSVATHLNPKLVILDEVLGSETLSSKRNASIEWRSWVDIELPLLPLNPGEYILNCRISDGIHPLAFLRGPGLAEMANRLAPRKDPFQP